MQSVRSTLLVAARIAAAGVLLALAAPAAAQSDYPNRPVRLIIPFPPGGSNDVVGRMIGTSLSEKLGKQVIVDNRAGAGDFARARGQSLALQAAVRPNQRLCADRRDGLRPERRGGASEPAGEFDQG